MAAVGAAHGGGPAPQIVRAMQNLRLALRMRLARGPLSEEQMRAIVGGLDAAAVDGGAQLMQTFTSQARLETPLAERYMIQLCKHFRHKLPVACEPGEGRIEFGSGICSMQATDRVLTLRAECRKTRRSSPGSSSVVERHLVRFAFRDKPALNWDRSAASA